MNRRAQQTRPQPEAKREDRAFQERVERGGSSKSGRALVVRVYWMFLGFIPIVASIAWIAEADGHAPPDLAYWASVASIVLARFYDVARLNGRTAEGEPATLGDWRRSSGILLVVAAIVWIVIHSIPSRG